MTPDQKQELWARLLFGNMPPNTTLRDLVECRSNSDWSALHQAAQNTCLPPETTTQDLIDCRDQRGVSALHMAAGRSKLLPDTTIAQLKDTKDKQGRSAWAALLEFYTRYPECVPDVPHILFANDKTAAIELAETAVTHDPSVQPAVTIWLGHILARTNSPTQSPTR